MLLGVLCWALNKESIKEIEDDTITNNKSNDFSIHIISPNFYIRIFMENNYRMVS